MDKPGLNLKNCVCKMCRKSFERDESVSCNPLAVLELKLLGNNLVLGMEHGVVVTIVAVGESAEYGLINHAKSHLLHDDIHDICRACVSECACKVVG